MSLIDKIRAAQIHAGEQAVIQHLRDMGAADMAIEDLVGEGVPARTVDSTSDARTTNNVMRHEYRVLSDKEKQQMGSVKDLGRELWVLIDSMGSSRELEQAQIKVEEAVMWAVKHITR